MTTGIQGMGARTTFDILYDTFRPSKRLGQDNFTFYHSTAISLLPMVQATGTLPKSICKVLLQYRSWEMVYTCDYTGDPLIPYENFKYEGMRSKDSTPTQFTDSVRLRLEFNGVDYCGKPFLSFKMHIEELLEKDGMGLSQCFAKEGGRDSPWTIGERKKLGIPNLDLEKGEEK
jgi:hypothetical protein